MINSVIYLIFLFEFDFCCISQSFLNALFQSAIVIENRFESLENSLKVQVMLGSNLEKILKSNGCVNLIGLAIFYLCKLWNEGKHIEISNTHLIAKTVVFL